MKKVCIVIGISGSGKSTWAKKFCQDNPTWLRINRDDIRKSMLSVSLNEYYTWEKSEIHKIEKLVTAQHDQLLVNALKSGWNVVLDNTHLRASYINDYRKLLESNFESFEISYKVFDTKLEDCLVNDQNRADIVGEKVILEQVQKMAQLRKVLKFQTETYTRESFQVEQNEALPPCILVDIDGTVASMQERFAFDWHRVGEDTPKIQVIRLVKSLKKEGYEIIFFSGRDAVCRAETSEWICRHFGWKEKDFQLFMRKEKDQRKDSLVKFELFNTHIRNQYYVEFVLDDRQQVVDMWRRKLGLTCLQVDYGDF